MPPVTRKGDNCTGHDACPPRPSMEGCPTVTVSGRELMRVGHGYSAHGCPVHPPHGATLADGAPHATLEGIRIGRIGDPVSCGGTVMEGEAAVTIGNKGGEDWGREFAFSLIRDPKDKIILCLPEIAAAEAERASGVDRVGWAHLHDLMNKWLQSPARHYPDIDPEPFWVDWDWVMSYARARNGYYLLTFNGNYLEPENIYNAAAKRQIAAYVARDLAAGKLTAGADGRVHFDYTKGTWRDWLAHSFQYHTVRREWLPPIEEGEILTADGLQASLAAFTLRALARGYMESEASGGRRITITGVSVFVEDRFTFQEVENFYYWSCEGKNFSLREEDGMTSLGGSDFVRFQEKYNCGNDFLTLTEPHEVEDFQEMSYAFPNHT